MKRIKSLFFIATAMSVFLAGYATATPPGNAQNVSAPAVNTPPRGAAPNQITGLKIQFPDNIKWVQITDHAGAREQMREWVPEGSTGRNTNWIIVEQTLLLRAPITSESFLRGSIDMARKVCKELRGDKVQKLPSSDGLDRSVGSYICTGTVGQDFATYTSQLVITQGNQVRIVTSELRRPPQPTVSPGTATPEQASEDREFASRVLRSDAVVRSVKVCTVAKPDC